MAGSWSALLRKQAREASLLERSLRLIKRWPRESEGFRRLIDRRFVDLDQAEHFVLDLQQIVGIEKLVAPEGFVLDVLWPRIERALLQSQGIIPFTM